MSKISKTNAARLLDQHKVVYELIPYEVDETDLGAQHIADQLGEDINQVFKTLVLQGDKTGYFVCVIPGAEEVDLKKAAKAEKKKTAVREKSKDKPQEKAQEKTQKNTVQ